MTCHNHRRGTALSGGGAKDTAADVGEGAVLQGKRYLGGLAKRHLVVCIYGLVSQLALAPAVHAAIASHSPSFLAVFAGSPGMHSIHLLHVTVVQMDRAHTRENPGK